jgi:hypothetical protein
VHDVLRCMRIAYRLLASLPFPNAEYPCGYVGGNTARPNCFQRALLLTPRSRLHVDEQQ